MLNTGLIIGVSRDLFEIELKKVTENTKKTKFKSPQEAFDATLEHFFVNNEHAHRSDYNENSCLVIKAYEEENQLSLDVAKFKKEDFAEFVKKCKNYPQDGEWFSIKIALAFKNMAKALKFEDVKLFVMNYS